MQEYTVRKYTFFKEDSSLLPLGTGKLSDIYSSECNAKYHSLCIGQLITLFGKADRRTDSYEDLISYTIGAKDQDGNTLILEAYHGPSGPAIGGEHSNPDAKIAARELAELIRYAKPSDYGISCIYEDFPSIIFMGVKDGEPYYDFKISPVFWGIRRIVVGMKRIFVK